MKITHLSAKTVAGIILPILLTILPVRAVNLVLPTENEAIYRGDGPHFYQYVERNFEGEISYPWQGGQYGFVRNPKRTVDGIIYQRLHEGVDIQPLRRDGQGNPVDLVRTVADGEVVYVNNLPGASNYGRYVVIRHIWDACPYFTLYAHLNRADVKTGDAVKQGQTIGLLGFTGAGIDRVRAHLHFEINLFLTENFETWHATYFPKDINRNGIYNGLNLAGLDVGKFLMQSHRDPALTIPAFLAKEEIFYKVKVPAPGPVELARRYPWMATNYSGRQAAEISFLRTGLPVKITGLNESVEQPTASWAHPEKAPISDYTKGYLQGSGLGLRLTSDGLRYLALMGGR